MNRAASQSPGRDTAAFTLIEMIGVLAIMSILASVIVPNVLRSMDRAAVMAEETTLANLGDQTKLYLRVNGVAPTPANWTTAIGSLADIAPVDIATNKRAIARSYITDPAATPTPRVLILSSMRAGLALPVAGNITTAAQFQNLWQTADKAIPSTASWGGWSTWSAVTGSGEYLVIERVNLASVYATDLASVTLTLNNRGTGTASYNLVQPNGASGGFVNVVAGGNVVLSGLVPRTRLNLYRAASGVTLNYTYVVSSSGRTFDYNGTNWIPQ